MEQQLAEIREQQKESWNKFSPGWKKWDEFAMDFLRPASDEIIQLLCLKDSDVVLDVAGGAGEPGLTMALKLKNGKVITDEDFRLDFDTNSKVRASFQLLLGRQFNADFNRKNYHGQTIV